MPVPSAAKAPTFVQASLLFRRCELADLEVIQLHRGRAVCRRGWGVNWDLRGLAGQPNDRGNGRGRSRWSHRDRGSQGRGRRGPDSGGLCLEFKGSFSKSGIQFGGQGLELLECCVVPGGQLVFDSTLQALIEGLLKAHVIQICVLGMDREARDVVGNRGPLLQVFESGRCVSLKVWVPRIES